MLDKQFSEELHKPIIKKKQKNVQSSFKNNISGEDLAYMQLINNYNKIFWLENIMRY